MVSSTGEKTWVSTTCDRLNVAEQDAVDDGISEPPVFRDDRVTPERVSGAKLTSAAQNSVAKWNTSSNDILDMPLCWTASRAS